MDTNDDALNRPERNAVKINAPPAEAVACAFTPEVKVEFDRIGQLLEEMTAVQQGTRRGVALNRVAIIVTAFLAFVSIVLSVIILLRPV